MLVLEIGSNILNIVLPLHQNLFIMERKKLIGHLSLLFANMIFGTNNPVSRMLMPEIIHPFALTYLRMAGGMVLFWLASLLIKKEKVPAKDLLMLFFASLFALNFNQIPFFTGLSMTSPIDASIVVTTMPIVTMILSAIILKEPITQLKAVGVLVGASGALVIVLNQNHAIGDGTMAGNLIVFAAVTSFSLYLTLFKNVIVKYSPITVMKWMFLFASITSFPFVATELKSTPFTDFSAQSWWLIAFVVLLTTFIGYLLIPIGQKVLRPTTLSMYNYVQPVMASLVAILVGIDTFGFSQAIAAVLVFSGVYIVTQSKSRAQLEAEKAAKLNKD